MKLKVCLVGERAVGKTSLARRYVFNQFSEAYEGTLGSELHRLQFTQHVRSDQIVEADVALFDYMGEHGAREAFRDALFYGTHGFIAVADASRIDTLFALPNWINAVTDVAGQVPYRVVVNKVDIASDAVEVVPRWLETYLPGARFSITSAKTGQEVGRAFELLVEETVEGILQRSRARRAASIASSRILLFAAKRGRTGVTKNELLVAFKDLDYHALMGEVNNLAKFEFVTVEDIGPANFRILVTEKGLTASEDANRASLVIDEPT